MNKKLLISITFIPALATTIFCVKSDKTEIENKEKKEAKKKLRDPFRYGDEQ